MLGHESYPVYSPEDQSDLRVVRMMTLVRRDLRGSFPVVEGVAECRLKDGSEPVNDCTVIENESIDETAVMDDDSFDGAESQNANDLVVKVAKETDHRDCTRAVNVDDQRDEVGHQSDH